MAGRVRGWVGVAQECAKRKRAAAALLRLYRSHDFGVRAGSQRTEEGRPKHTIRTIIRSTFAAGLSSFSSVVCSASRRLPLALVFRLSQQIGDRPTFGSKLLAPKCVVLSLPPFAAFDVRPPTSSCSGRARCTDVRADCSLPVDRRLRRPVSESDYPQTQTVCKQRESTRVRM